MSLLLLFGGTPNLTTTGDPGDLTTEAVDATITAGAVSTTGDPGETTLDAEDASTAVSVSGDPGDLTTEAVDATVTPGAASITGAPGEFTSDGEDATITAGPASTTGDPGDATFTGVDATVTAGAASTTGGPAEVTLAVVQPVRRGRKPYLYWGPHFPDAASNTTGKKFWGPHFPDPGRTANVARYGPTTAATFILLLDGQVSVSYQWATDIFKARSGLERRANLVDDPGITISGNAILNAADTLAIRARLAQFAALGRPFGLALPFEETILTADADGAKVFCDTTDRDWAVAGQAVALINYDNTAVERVIQAVTTTEIILDSSPGDAGLDGRRIMPIVPIYLDPQQTFLRYPSVDERWQISGRMAVPGYVGVATCSYLELATVCDDEVLSGVTFRALVAGEDGDGITVALQWQSPPAEGEGEILYVEYAENTGAQTITLTFTTGATLAHLYAAISSYSTLIEMVGTWTDADTLDNDEAEFSSTALSNGTDAAPADMGKGISLVQHNNRIVYDRPLKNDGTAEDGMHSMTELVDLGGLIANVGVAKQPDWKRAIALEGPLQEEWQWAKSFLGTVKGAWKSFWLPSWRPDLTYVSTAVGTPAVQASVSLNPPQGNSGALDGLEVRYKTAGTVGNGYTVTFSSAVGASIVETETGVAVTFNPSATTVDDVIALFDGLDYVEIVGAPVDGEALLALSDQFGPTAMTGGTAAVPSRLVVNGPNLASGSFYAWYPHKRRDIQVLQSDGTCRYYFIQNATNNNNGTMTLDLDDAPDDVAMISWLELCRLEGDQVQPTFMGPNFALGLLARGVTQPSTDGEDVDSWLDAEKSVEESQPREAVEVIVNEATTYRWSLGTRDITIDGDLYTATPAMRGEVSVTTLDAGGEMTMTIPSSHALVKRWMQGVPVSAAVNVWRYQGAVDDARCVWRGLITNIKPSDTTAEVRVTSRLAIAAQRRLPVITVGRECSHELFGPDCKVVRASHTLDATVTAVDGREITINSLGLVADQWARFGEIELASTGERVTITSQIGTDLVLFRPLVGLAIGSIVNISAGCDRLVGTCDSKFANRPNFGNAPHLPNKSVGGIMSMFDWNASED